MREEMRGLRGESARGGADRSTRRGVLAMAAGGALAATLATTAPADAASGDPLVLGSSFNTVGASTGLAVSGTTAGYGIGVTDNGLNSVPDVGPALLGHAKNENFRTGLLAFIEPGVSGCDAVHALNNGSGAEAVLADSSANGVWAVAGSGGDGVVGMNGLGETGVHGISIGQDAPAVWAEGQVGGGPGLKATSASARGVVASGKLAQLQLTPGKQATHPKRGEAGDLFVDKSARLWFCKVGGGTATWVQVA